VANDRNNRDPPGSVSSQPLSIKLRCFKYIEGQKPCSAPSIELLSLRASRSTERWSSQKYTRLTQVRISQENIRSLPRAPTNPPPYLQNLETGRNDLGLSHPTAMTKLDVQQNLPSSPEKEFLFQLIFSRTFWGEVRRKLTAGRAVGFRPQCGETSTSMLGGVRF
jgi:hypothetical protein